MHIKNFFVWRWPPVMPSSAFNNLYLVAFLWAGVRVNEQHVESLLLHWISQECYRNNHTSTKGIWESRAFFSILHKWFVNLSTLRSDVTWPLIGKGFLKCICLKENVWIPLKLKFTPRAMIDKLALVEIMACCLEYVSNISWIAMMSEIHNAVWLYMPQYHGHMWPLLPTWINFNPNMDK